MITLKSWKVEGPRLIVEINGAGRTEFNYPADKFKSKAQLLREIERSLNIENNKKAKKLKKVKELENDLNA